MYTKSVPMKMYKQTYYRAPQCCTCTYKASTWSETPAYLASSSIPSVVIIVLGGGGRGLVGSSFEIIIEMALCHAVQ